MGWLRREARAVAGGLPATFWWLWLGTLVNALASFVVPFLALFLVRRGFSPAAAGLLVGMAGAGTIVAGPVGGVLADRVGRRATVLLSLLCTAATTAALAFAPGAASAAALVAVLGLGANLYRPAAMALVADVVPQADRARAFGLNYWAVNLGFAVSLVLGGTIAERSFTGLFLADAATTLLFAAVVFGKVPETRPAEAAAGREPVLRGLAEVARDGVFAVFLVLHVLYASTLLQFFAAAPIDMQAHGVGPAAFGRVLAVNGIVIALLQPLAPRLTARLDPGRVLAAAALLTGAGYGLFAVFREPILYALAVAILTLGEIAHSPTATALVAHLSPAARRGQYQGAYSMGWGIAFALGPALGSLVLDRLGGTVLWIGCAVLGVATAAGQLAAAPARRRRLAAQGAAAPASGPAVP
ncbi:MAG TPA: MFS transporter [Anaeromyxobacteraceae bacterium]|nr:MFS transporter [Anaeromyxobacteraceae bacterium]